MPVDFHDPANALTYSGRDADPAWGRAVTTLLDATGCTVVDVGCGGGTYAREWLRLGASAVIGVDSSVPILAAARADATAGLVLREGEATATGLPDGSHDIVFARALVHHVPDLRPVVAEARRLLRPGGHYLVQDRTMEDVDQPGSPDHPRGWFFEAFPACGTSRPAAARKAGACATRWSPRASTYWPSAPCGRCGGATPTVTPTSPT
ncbi:class I SAM-dependent methyltransferase [Cellulomonas soli]